MNGIARGDDAYRREYQYQRKRDEQYVFKFHGGSKPDKYA
jgi:hypothetical protein